MLLDSQRFKKLVLRSLHSSWVVVTAFLVHLGWAPLLRLCASLSRLDELPLSSTLLDNLVTGVKGIVNVTVFSITAYCIPVLNFTAPVYAFKAKPTDWVGDNDVCWSGMKLFQVRVWLDSASRLRSKIASRRQQIVRQSCSLAVSAKGWL